MASVEKRHGENLLKRLQAMYLLHPSVVTARLPKYERFNQVAYFAGVTAMFLSYVQVILRLIIGVIYPDVGSMLGNYFSPFGVPGKMTSFATIGIAGVGLFFRLAIYNVRTDTPFIADVLAYDNPRESTILTGKYRREMIRRMDNIKTIYFLRWVMVLWSCGTLTTMAIGSIMETGYDTWNIVKWFLWTFLTWTNGYIIMSDVCLTIGLWSLCKKHFDLQAKVIVDLLTDMIDGKVGFDAIHDLLSYHSGLVLRLDQFNEFSTEVITSYRIMTTLLVGIDFYTTGLFPNIVMATTMKLTIIFWFVISLYFLGMTFTLSNRKRKLYQLTNNLFFKMMTECDHCLRRRMSAKRLLKSLGAIHRPTICLTDTAYQELDQLEFFEYLMACVEMYILIVNLHQTHFTI